ncbi:MAG: TonB family protein [Gammaproteobacteria bacterium]|nr:TonB family protein [Gammaproteobacteria bacterium]
MRLFVLLLITATVFVLAGCSSPQKLLYKTSPDAEQYSTLVRINYVEPVFPDKAERNARQGCVNVGYHLDKQGRPTRLQVIADIPKDIFDKATVRAIAQWRYRATDPQGQTITPPDNIELRQIWVYRWGMMDGKTLSILHWLCEQTVSRTLVALPAPPEATAPGIHAVKNAPVDLVAMPVDPGTALTTGWVDVNFCIDAKSRVIQPSIRGSSPRGLYDEVAVAALKTWNFRARRTNSGHLAKTCGLTYRIRILGAASLARGPGIISRRETIFPVSQLGLSPKSTPHHGRVTLQYCVDGDGSVSDARVISSKPTNAFDRTALKMLQIWEYWPKMVNGSPVRVCGVQTSVDFELGEDNLVWIHAETSDAG